jgi:hypothetical protein
MTTKSHLLDAPICQNQVDPDLVAAQWIAGTTNVRKASQRPTPHAKSVMIT